MNKTVYVMEEHEKTVTVRKKVARTFPHCDLCGARLSEDDTDYVDNDHATYFPLFEECTVDVCDNCTKDKVIPWLESQKIKPTV